MVKILHDAPQDLTILRRATGAFPCSVFDTRCAAGLACLSSTLSLSDLVADVLGVQLGKTESRTDWLQRPLTPEQILYAAEDVTCLHALRQELLRRAADLGRDKWLKEELAVLDDPGLYGERDPREQYRHVKGSGRASRRELAILRELAAWREEEARRSDRPRGRVVQDATLMQLARTRPGTRAAVREVNGLGRRYADGVLEGIERGLSVPAEQCPERKPRRHPAEAKALRARTELAMRRLREVTAAARMDAPFVASRAEVASMVGDRPRPDPARHRLLRGWRRHLVGDELLDLLSDSPRPAETGR